MRHGKRRRCMPEWLRYRDAASEKLNQIQKHPDKHVRVFFRRQISSGFCWQRISGRMSRQIFGNKIRGADMILFEFKFGNKHSSTLIQKYPDILKYEGFFNKNWDEIFFKDAPFLYF